MGELLPGRYRHQSVPGDRQLHRYAVTPVVAHQAQGQATPGRDLSTLASVRALRARPPDCAWARRAVGEGVMSCPRAGCGKSARPFGGGECEKGATAEPQRHRKTKEAKTDILNLPPPRHIPTLPERKALRVSPPTSRRHDDPGALEKNLAELMAARIAL